MVGTQFVDLCPGICLTNNYPGGLIIFSWSLLSSLPALSFSLALTPERSGKVTSFQANGVRIRKKNLAVSGRLGVQAIP
jgi:hypothetical protein